MRHNSVVSGHLKSTGIPQVDRLSRGPQDLGRRILEPLSRQNKSCRDIGYYSKEDSCRDRANLCHDRVSN